MRKLIDNLGYDVGYTLGYCVATIAIFVNFVLFPFPRF